MAHLKKTQTVLPERPKPPSIADMLEDLKSADDKDVAFTALQIIGNNTGDNIEETAKVKLNKDLEETHATLLTDAVNENSNILKEFEKVKQFLEANHYLETSKNSLETDLISLVSANDEIMNTMKQLQDQLGQR